MGSRVYCDDNFGTYEPSDDPEADQEFYDYMQRNSVDKVCEGCQRTVRIKFDYGYCNSCATKREQGRELDY